MVENGRRQRCQRGRVMLTPANIDASALRVSVYVIFAGMLGLGLALCGLVNIPKLNKQNQNGSLISREDRMMTKILYQDYKRKVQGNY